MKKLGLAGMIALAAACGGSSTPAPSSAASPSSASSGSSAAPSCEAIAKACHSHSEHVPVAKECHELGHKAPSEEACAARKAECLAACPAG